MLLNKSSIIFFTLLCPFLVFAVDIQHPWLTCVTTGTDYTGDNVISGLRFSREECAIWCQKIGIRCVRWVYVEKGTTCYIKSLHGDPRTKDDPLTEDDKAEFAPPPDDDTDGASTDTPANNETDSSSRRKRESEMTPEEERIALRLAELAVTHSGLEDCMPPKEVFWDACVVRSKEIDGTDLGNGTINDLEMDQCSFECSINPDCKFWLWKDTICYLKSDKGTEADNLNSFYGVRSCSGRVEEPPEADEKPLDGNWSPWSTFETPCFNKRSGELVDCGGGVQYRYRSCSNPHPRAGGKTCKGENFDEYPCNLNNCPLPTEFLWSEWGATDNPCGHGVQQRTTMCGALRRRLPNLGNDDGAPPVYWPKCLTNKLNEAEVKQQQDGITLTVCMENCKMQPEDVCYFWTYNKTEETCKYSSILKAENGITGDDILTGSRFCSGKLFYPYCAETDVNYSGAPVIESYNTTTTIEECVDYCKANAECENWLHATSGDTCELRGAIPDGEASVALTANGTTYKWGSKTCVKSTKDVPALPEDAEEISYKEICKDDQLQVMTKENNTWNQEFCPSPCEGNGPCVRGSQCIDLSDDIAPNHTCVCRMGLVMEGGRCIAAPPTTPVSHVVVTLESVEKATTMAISKTATFILIGFVSTTLVIFALGRIFNTARFIHMNIELALLGAHLCLIPDATGNELMCKIISIFLHFFFTVVFAFFMLEAIFMYSILANVVRKDGMMSKSGNFFVGWGIGIIVLAFSCSFEYDSYAGEYHCWLDYETALLFAQLVPNTSMFIATIMMIEAAGSVDETTMTRLEGYDEAQRTSAKFMHRSLILRVGVCFVSFLLGSLAEYEQSVGLYMVFTILNGVLGFLIFFFHCSSNEFVRAKLSKIFCRKKNETETESLTKDDEKP